MKNIVIATMLGTLMFVNSAIAAYTVKGKVIDDTNGKGVANVIIVAKADEKIDIVENKKYEVIKGKSNKSGEYQLNGLSVKYGYTINMESNEYMPGRNKSRHVGGMFSRVEDKTTKLVDPISVVKKMNARGEVLDGVTLKPISKASVNGEALICESSYRYIGGVTDEKGAYSIRWPFPYCEYTMTVKKEGYVDKTFNYTYNGYDDSMIATLIKVPNYSEIQISKGKEYLDVIKPLGGMVKVVQISNFGRGGGTTNGQYYISKEVFEKNIKEVDANSSLFIRVNDNSREDYFRDLKYFPVYYHDKYPNYYFYKNNNDYEIQGYHNDKDIYVFGKAHINGHMNTYIEPKKINTSKIGQVNSDEDMIAINMSQFAIDVPIAILNTKKGDDYLYIVKPVVDKQETVVDYKNALEKYCAGRVKCIAAATHNDIKGFNKIQDAIDYAGFGYHIWISEGDYFETIKIIDKENLIIHGKNANIVTKSNEATVLEIKNSNRINLTGVRLVHSTNLACSGNCINVFDSRNITIDGNDIEGSGYCGILASNVLGLKILNNKIHGCQEGVTLYNSDGVSLFDNKLYDNNLANVKNNNSTILNDIGKYNELSDAGNSDIINSNTVKRAKKNNQ